MGWREERPAMGIIKQTLQPRYKGGCTSGRRRHARKRGVLSLYVEFFGARHLRRNGCVKVYCLRLSCIVPRPKIAGVLMRTTLPYHEVVQTIFSPGRSARIVYLLSSRCQVTQFALRCSRRYPCNGGDMYASSISPLFTLYEVTHGNIIMPEGKVCYCGSVMGGLRAAGVFRNGKPAVCRLVFILWTLEV
ncbi:hypothetical protein LZ30DRAFT_409416 [Colletotrichum cereale]|nr:hypothetical protein LZ30DRAFT_409416 [Colletotrichum cereale]